MRILAIDSATEACSAALFDDTTCIASFHKVIGRGHAETLVPAIANFPGKGRADRILVSLGPGSFTGVRIGLAAARALGLAWDAQVLGYPALALVAAMARAQHPGPVTVCMAAGHGEYFVQNFSADAIAQDTVRSLTPEQASAACRHQVIAGSKAQQLAAALGGDHRAIDLLPDASQSFLLSDDVLATDLSPIYGRAPDARLPGVKA
ncbi:tRNA (adenosine(37)-N6)-threonylcarbamoyltransferase complex dimerization subunit type 1 TsaB [Alteraurantiacibacter aestuarii]|uniref:tRNA (Adenosine(37)-N6)-threonylcarbamoyltransferase complex dimerization subunit type 1 TsaB n=1 Tax=Alteraurantiacibacter aestuarii TaxID=650004 RepID=A0A844ZJY4_9SPHN|nr:tRNA (adenosine(37)-N6)-threonylcarbamoyltransferase complex dimerization subunit type 1 TsaB [Alteraurantiacibacter aestuarii]MXO87874.1 tRNA (adenosine(37)-N6)-threonylcarbamoyltransferase complex dimerization subunit type 1 TsaB [Alteraurantiacibacter aestuarii]